MSTSDDIVSTGFGQGFSKEVEAILNVADRGLLYAQEIRENLQKAGMIIYEKIELPDVEPPAVGPSTVNPEEFEDFVLPDDNFEEPDNQ